VRWIGVAFAGHPMVAVRVKMLPRWLLLMTSVLRFRDLCRLRHPECAHQHRSWSISSMTSGGSSDSNQVRHPECAHQRVHWSISGMTCSVGTRVRQSRHAEEPPRQERKVLLRRYSVASRSMIRFETYDQTKLRLDVISSVPTSPPGRTPVHFMGDIRVSIPCQPSSSP